MLRLSKQTAQLGLIKGHVSINFRENIQLGHGNYFDADIHTLIKGIRDMSNTNVICEKTCAFCKCSVVLM